MLKITWTGKITNEEEVYEEKSILRAVQKRNVLRDDGMLLTILEGRAMGTRQRGRIGIHMINDNVGNESYVKTKRKTEDRRHWMWEASSRLSVTQICFIAGH